MTQILAKPASAPSLALWRDAAASVADMGTFLPLAVGLAISGGLNFGVILICAGLANIHSGWRFRLPIPVQPMKALAAVAIAGAWTSGDLALSGLFMGLALITLSLTGAAHHISACMPTAAVRGIQLAAAILLTLKAIHWLAATPLLPASIAAPHSLSLALAALAIMYHPRLPRGWTVLAIFITGLVLSHWAPIAVTVANNTPTAFAAFTNAHWQTAAQGVLVQLPLTLLNSVIAVCALSEDLFPARGISPQRMSLNVGVINLFSSVAGGMPMCHGSGGLAAVHACGARTGAAPIFLGIAMLLCGALLSQGALSLLQTFPKSLLAALLIITSLSLAQAALKPILKNRRTLLLTLAIAALLLFLQH